MFFISVTDINLFVQPRMSSFFLANHMGHWTLLMSNIVLDIDKGIWILTRPKIFEFK